MSKKRYVIREFTVCKRKDSDNLIINCHTFIAKMYNDYGIEVNGKIYRNNFNEVFTENIP